MTARNLSAPSSARTGAPGVFLRRYLSMTRRIFDAVLRASVSNVVGRLPGRPAKLRSASAPLGTGTSSSAGADTGPTAIGILKDIDWAEWCLGTRERETLRLSSTRTECEKMV